MRLQEACSCAIFYFASCSYNFMTHDLTRYALTNSSWDHGERSVLPSDALAIRYNAGLVFFII